MSKILALAWMAAAVSFAGTPAELYDSGLRQTAAGRFDQARYTLRNLVASYPADPLAWSARCAIDATLLFEEGQARARAGKFPTAQLAFETLLAVYPESPLAPRAQAELQSLAGKVANRGPLVAEVDFRAAGLPAERIRAALDQREVRLAVGRQYRPADVQQARTALAHFLAEQGLAGVRIRVETKVVDKRAAHVIFRVEVPRG